MINGQKLKTPNGVEVSLYPRKTMNVTQGVNGSYSHKGSMAIDDAGEDSGIDNFYAPVTLRCSSKDGPGGVNGCNYQTVNPVLCPDKVIRNYTLRVIHDNDTSDISVGIIYPQGTRINNEGTMGKATGNHNHIVIGDGLISGSGLVRNPYGVYEMKNELNPVDVFFVDNTILMDTDGYAWKSYANLLAEESKSLESIKLAEAKRLESVRLAEVAETKRLESEKLAELEKINAELLAVEKKKQEEKDIAISLIEANIPKSNDYNVGDEIIFEGNLFKDSNGLVRTKINYRSRHGVIDIIGNDLIPIHVKGIGWTTKENIKKI